MSSRVIKTRQTFPVLSSLGDLVVLIWDVMLLSWGKSNSLFQLGGRAGCAVNQQTSDRPGANRLRAWCRP